MRLVPLEKRPLGILLSLCHKGLAGKTAMHGPEGSVSSDTGLAGNLTLDFPGSMTDRRRSLLSISHQSVVCWYSSPSEQVQPTL